MASSTKETKGTQIFLELIKTPEGKKKLAKSMQEGYEKQRADSERRWHMMNIKIVMET